MMKKKFFLTSVLFQVLIGAFSLGLPSAVQGTKVNLPTVREVLAVLNMQESLKPTTFVLMSKTVPTKSVCFSIQVCPQSGSQKQELSLRAPLVVPSKACFQWKSWIVPRNCFVQGDIILDDPHRGKLLVRVMGRFHFPSWAPPTCELHPEDTPPTEWEFGI